MKVYRLAKFFTKFLFIHNKFSDYLSPTPPPFPSSNWTFLNLIEKSTVIF